MRSGFLSLMFAVFLAGPVLAQDGTGGSSPAAVPDAKAEQALKAPKTPAEQLDDLFAALAKSADEREAKGIERKIVAIWHQSGSPTIDLLVRRAVTAIREKDYPLALDYLDSVVMLKPDYAEGWNKRATVYYLLDDYGQSLADIEHVLDLEPRHFGALSGLGRILEEMGDEKRALDVFEYVLKIHPHFAEIEKEVEDLKRATGGRDI